MNPFFNSHRRVLRQSGRLHLWRTKWRTSIAVNDTRELASPLNNTIAVALEQSLEPRVTEQIRIRRQSCSTH
jgi:hypothetical protein